jgi:hypothetical protein
MTLVVSIICDDGSIVVCSDSEASNPDFKTLYAKKIHRLKKDSPALIIGGAGDPAYYSMLIRKVELFKGSIGIGDVEQIAAGIFKDFAPRERVVQIESPDGRASLGYNFLVAIEESAPALYHVFENGKTQKMIPGEPGHASIGHGFLWSEWFLNEFRGNFINSNIALQIALYVLEVVKEIDPTVGGITQASRIRHDRRNGWIATILSKERVGEITKQVNKRRQFLNSLWVLSATDPKFYHDLQDDIGRRFSGRKK